MISEIAGLSVSQDTGSASEIKNEIIKRGPGAHPTALHGEFTAIIEDYAAALGDAPLSPESRRTYLSRVRMYLAWLTGHRITHSTSDPITNPKARDWAVRDYRRWLLHDGPTTRSVVYANSALTAIDDFYTRRGLGKARVDRDELPQTAPRALDEQARIRWLRAVEAHLSPRDRALALIPYYAGARISEVVSLDVSEVHRSARKAQLRIWGKGGKPRTVGIHKNLRTELDQWLEERPNWPHADDNPALFLNTKGGRLSVRAASGIIRTIARDGALTDEPTAHVLRHTLATTLVRGHTDLVIVAELLGHARLETTRRQSCRLKKTRRTRLTSSPPTADQREFPHHRRLARRSRTGRYSSRSTDCRNYMYLGWTRSSPTADPCAVSLSSAPRRLVMPRSSRRETLHGTGVTSARWLRCRRRQRRRSPICRSP